MKTLDSCTVRAQSATMHVVILIPGVPGRDSTDSLDICLSDHPKPANEGHLKTGQR